ncbi:DUF5672 family protein [Flavobacterium laiguense]|uniref:DUF5672 domain-containing protein n=1 Tax=Flavobacterium laiguense TaxID=2169409 RepID=A0A2U1K085_9FLAO|nr:DUF5672 family protein [Flavobacterium laiguense]PWA10881.1 hypothetical protein DB891_03375 [Flavobacterium laiguense]
MEHLVKVVIPIYRNYFGDLEEKSFLQCINVLKDYPIVLVQPEGLDNAYITEKFSNVMVETFSKHYFENISGYNELLLSESFYERFLDSEYILIYQLDAFVFKDTLKEWCGKGYDYIGAPWIATQHNSVGMKIFDKIATIFNSKKKNERKKIFYKVGNGGFSLRKTSIHYKIAKEQKAFISDFLGAEKKEIYAIEDVFWSIKVPELYKDFKIPDYREALHFAIDRKPKIAFKLVNNEIPFGCHGINKPKVIDFWKPILDNY